MPQFLFRKFFLAGCFLAVLFCLLSPAAGGAGELRDGNKNLETVADKMNPPHLFTGELRGGNKNLETMYASVSYRDDPALLDFGRRIGAGEAALVRDDGRAREMAKENIDRLVFRVKTLLDMHPPKFRFSIIVLSTNKEIDEAYRALGLGGTAPIAFYRQKSHTVYVSLDKLSPGVLAHEVAHAVINAFFSTPPPAQMQEILAQYVDKHLWD